jgi:hypothetical protein
MTSLLTIGMRIDELRNVRRYLVADMVAQGHIYSSMSLGHIYTHPEQQRLKGFNFDSMLHSEHRNLDPE